MPDALARARRLRMRALECERIAHSSQPEFAKHYHIIAKHYFALARLDEGRLSAPQPADAVEEKEHTLTEQK